MKADVRFANSLHKKVVILSGVICSRRNQTIPLVSADTFCGTLAIETVRKLLFRLSAPCCLSMLVDDNKLGPPNTVESRNTRPAFFTVSICACKYADHAGAAAWMRGFRSIIDRVSMPPNANLPVPCRGIAHASVQRFVLLIDTQFRAEKIVALFSTLPSFFS
jgi:hypothetical protein